MCVKLIWFEQSEPGSKSTSGFNFVYGQCWLKHCEIVIVA